MSRRGVALTSTGEVMQWPPVPAKVHVVALVAGTWSELPVSDGCDAIEIDVDATIFIAFADMLTDAPVDGETATAEQKAQAWQLRAGGTHGRACNRPAAAKVFVCADGAATTIRVGEHSTGVNL